MEQERIEYAALDLMDNRKRNDKIRKMSKAPFLRLERARRREAIFEQLGEDVLRRKIIKKMCTDGISAKLAESRILMPPEELRITECF